MLTLLKRTILSAMLIAAALPVLACDQTGQPEPDALRCKVAVLAQEIGRLESEKLDLLVELRLTQAALAAYDSRLATAMEWLKAAQDKTP